MRLCLIPGMFEDSVFFAVKSQHYPEAFHSRAEIPRAVGFCYCDYDYDLCK